MPLESKYQRDLKKRIEQLFPGCVILKQDASLRQGIPDLLILYRDKWALLEVKASATAERQPNQEYYVENFNLLSFAAFIYPENEEEVLNALQRTFGSRRPARVSQR